MRIQAQDWVRACPPKTAKTVRIKRIEPISPVSKVPQAGGQNETLGEAFILSETADFLMKVFVFGVAPLYIFWLVAQAVRLWVMCS